MLLREVIPLCARRFKLGGGGRKRAVIGWSMGGYGALLAAETEPDLFAAVVAVSPAVWTSYDAMMLGPQDAFDNAADFAEHDVIGHADRLAGVNLLIDCGLSDPFYGYVTHLEAALPEPPSGGYSRGGHDPDYWQRGRPPRRRSSDGRSADPVRTRSPTLSASAPVLPLPHGPQAAAEPPALPRGAPPADAGAAPPQGLRAHRAVARALPRRPAATLPRGQRG